jgi:hypothetical protein
MISRYLISSPDGEFPVGPDLLGRPFRITPSEDHPTLTLRAYFGAVENFLVETLLESQRTDLQEGCNTKIVIRSEKHGVLYHIASVALFSKHQPIKFAVSTAVTEKARHWLRREHRTLHQLEQHFHLPYLPRVFGLGEVLAPGDPKSTPMTMVLAEWLEGYSEWHLSVDETIHKEGISVWDSMEGIRWASEDEAWQIFKQASHVLTRYYDTKTYCQIYPWHHAAGDFVVKIQPSGWVDVKLTTARQYEPITQMLQHSEMEPMAALVYFFLNLTLRMRLDKQDGVGEPRWAGSFSLKAVLEGFLEALAAMEKEGRCAIGDGQEILSLLKSFTLEELGTLFAPLLSSYEDEDPADLGLIRANLGKHVSQLHRIIQRFH